MQQNSPRIVFVGAHFEACRPFRHLIASSENIVGLFTLEPSSLAQMSGGVDLTPFATAAKIPIKIGKNVNAPDAASWIRRLAPDLLLVVGWTQLLKPELLQVPRLACLGFHASLLPKYRGRAPVNWAILNGDTETGNTMIVLEPGADEGDLVSQRGIPITEQDDCATIYEKVSLTECEMLDEVLPLIRQGRMPRRKQNSLEATVMPKRRPEDGLIDWRWTTRRLYNWVRALTHPYPGAFSYVCGRKIIIWKTRVEDGTIHSQKLYGTVEASPDGFPLVALQDGHLRILQVECEGHHPASGPEALRTFLQPGSIFHDAARREAQ